MVTESLATHACPNCRRPISADAALCNACDAILDDPTGWKPVSLAAALEIDRKRAEITTAGYLFNGAVMLFPAWGTYTLLRLFHSGRNADAGLGEICVVLSLCCAAPIWRSNSLGVLGKIFGTLAYYTVTAMVMLFVVLAAVGTA
jgi:hypothetical protein